MRFGSGDRRSCQVSKNNSGGPRGLTRTVHPELGDLAIAIMRSKWFTPYEILVQATSRAGELIALAGPRNPYSGKLGVIEEGAYADMLLVDGNPLENIELVGHPEMSFVLIMKDGTIYKNTVE